MNKPTICWTKVALCDDEDDTSNKFYVMLSQKDYERYSSDPEYARTLLDQAKNQAIANTIPQKDDFNENPDVQVNSEVRVSSEEVLQINSVVDQVNSENSESILGFQFATSNSPEKLDENQTKTFRTRSLEGKWSLRATNLLVELVKQNSVGLRSRNVKKIVFWKKICEFLKKRNYNFTWTQVQKKWCNLFKTYKHLKGRQLIPNKKRGGSTKIPLWPFMDVFDLIYENDPKIAQIVSISKQSKNNIDYQGMLRSNEPACGSSDEEVKVKRDKNFAKELNEIHKLLAEKNKKEEEALMILKNLAEKSAEQEDRRTKAIETLTACVTQLTDTIKSLVNKQ